MHNARTDQGHLGSRAYRSASGQAGIALNIVIGVFIIGVLFTFAWELTRFLLAREQLKTVVQASALAGEATILSSTQTVSSAQNTAQQTALNIFKRNAVLGSLLSSASLVSSPTQLSPAAGQTQLAIEWIDPITRQTGSPNASVLRLTAAYNYALFSAHFLGTKAVAYTMSVSEIAALPKVDIVVLMDESESMDDQTMVTTVQRSWDYGAPGIGSITYTYPPGGGSGGTVSSLTCANPMGSGLNALWPQNLEVASVASTPCTTYWSEIGYPNTATYTTRGMRGVTNTASPPGNGPLPPPPPAPGARPGPPGPPPLGPALGPFGLYNGVNPATAGPQRYNGNTNLEYMAFNGKSGLGSCKWPNINLNLVDIFSNKMPWELAATAQGTSPAPQVHYPGSMFTDIIVNIDGNQGFAGFTTPDGYTFPDKPSLLEASRGNLENASVYYLSGASRSGIGVVPKAGYQAAYVLAAAQQVLPQAVVHTSTATFMNKLINATDAHFGFVAFGDRAGTAPNDAFQNFNVSWDYDVAGASNFPLPNIPLDPSSNNYTAVQRWLTPPTTVGTDNNIISVNGGTNTADALQKGIDQLTNPAMTRRGSMKAIVLITDGVPTRDIANRTAFIEGANAQAQADAITQANRAKAAGIPIYAIALAQDPSTMGTALDQAYSDTVPGSILNTVGHGSRYYRVNWTNRAGTQPNCDATYGNIARQLTSLIR
jgi:hypothetical protein